MALLKGKSWFVLDELSRIELTEPGLLQRNQESVRYQPKPLIHLVSERYKDLEVKVWREELPKHHPLVANAHAGKEIVYIVEAEGRRSRSVKNAALAQHKAEALLKKLEEGLDMEREEETRRMREVNPNYGRF